MGALIFSYTLGLLGAYLLAPHIMPQALLSRVGELTNIFEGWTLKLNDQVYYRLKRLATIRTSTSWKENLGCAIGMIGAVALVTFFGWAVHRVPLLKAHEEYAGALYLAWCLSFKINDILLENRSRLATWSYWLLILICLPFIASAFLTRIPLFILVRGLPILLLGLVTGPVFVMHLVLSGQLKIATWSKQTPPQRFLGYLGLLMLTISAIIQISKRSSHP
jgi:hypothetical protein